MLRLAIVFLVIALIAGLFNFFQLEGFAWWAAKAAFVVFLILAVISFLFGSLRGRPPV